MLWPENVWYNPDNSFHQDLWDLWLWNQVFYDSYQISVLQNLISNFSIISNWISNEPKTLFNHSLTGMLYEIVYGWNDIVLGVKYLFNILRLTIWQICQYPHCFHLHVLDIIIRILKLEYCCQNAKNICLHKCFNRGCIYTRNQSSNSSHQHQLLEVA